MQCWGENGQFSFFFRSKFDNDGAFFNAWQLPNISTLIWFLRICTTWPLHSDLKGWQNLFLLFSVFGHFQTYWSLYCMIFLVFEVFWWKKIQFKNFESSLYEKKMIFCLIKSTFSYTWLVLRMHACTRMPYGSKWISIHKK